ncbi:hypothetical protein GOODEAATRI_017633 [Goodea atripinnis]|uniref:Uncharacterized protein n=1 Tax=Goodea atripinnis TaxID=208336 RepID=A0ABV0PEV2_9TELE
MRATSLPEQNNNDDGRCCLSKANAVPADQLILTSTSSSAPQGQPQKLRKVILFPRCSSYVRLSHIRCQSCLPHLSPGKKESGGLARFLFTKRENNALTAKYIAYLFLRVFD